MRPSARRSHSGGGRGPTFPTLWSDWEWNAVWKCEYRYRHVAANGTDADVEYEYRNPEAPRGQSSNPASATALSTIQESSNTQEVYTPDNYTYNLQSATEAFRRTDLNSSVGGAPVQAQYEQGRPTSAGRSSSYYSGQNYLKSSNADRHIITKDSNVQTDLDPEYKVNDSWQFKFGRVFKVLWSEPTGSTGTVITGMVTKAKHGENAYSSIRRFVIVDPRQGHCICLPILTYGGQATLKKGVHASDHAVIYTGKAPVMKSKEKITKRAIRMDPISPQHKLDITSRINYAKLYTIEHNVKVYFIGEIAKKYEQQVVTDYNATHKPLPDRPFYPGTSDENTFGYAQGADPGYTARKTTSSWPNTATNAPSSVSYYSQPSVYGPSTNSYTVPYTNASQPTYSSTTPYTIPISSTAEPTESYNPDVYQAQDPQDPQDSQADSPKDDNKSPRHYEKDLYDE